MSQPLLNKLLNGCPEAVLLVDSKNRIAGCNASVRSILGRTTREIRSLAFDSLVAPADRPRLWEALGRCSAARGPSSPAMRLEVEALRPDGRKFPAELTLLPIPSDRRTLVGAYIRDLTESKHLEAQLRQSRKLEAVGRLAGGIAHDFKNFLTVIVGYGDLLRTRLEQDDASRAMVDEILSAGERAAGLMRQLLTFSRKKELAPRNLSLNAVVADMEKMLRQLVPKEIRLETALGPDLGSVQADPSQVEQVLMNLVVNARDAMPTGGTLTIRTADVSLEPEDAARYPDAKPGPHVMLSVSDTGEGIDPANQSRIFEPFFSTKPEDQGTGLGLSTVYGIVQQSGGHLRVISEPGRGSNFEIFFPRTEGEAEGERFSVSELTAIKGSETILVVDDSDTVRSLSSRILRAKGYQVLHARDGKEALRVSQDHDGPIDLLVTDMIMPKMNGRELALQIRQARPLVRVLYVSGYPQDGFPGLEGIGSKDAFLQKPFTPYLLGSKVRELLGTLAKGPRPAPSSSR